jgi:hypothetical protein
MEVSGADGVAREREPRTAGIAPDMLAFRRKHKSNRLFL